MSGAVDESLPVWKPSFNPWLIATSVMLATFMEILDTSVANVSLPHIAGNLSATTDESTWVLTSYLIANALVLPSAGWLSNYFGRKKIFLTCIMLFTLASVLAGSAPTLGFLIVTRALQGLAGGGFPPNTHARGLGKVFPPQPRPSHARFWVGGGRCPPTCPPLWVRGY